MLAAKALANVATFASAAEAKRNIVHAVESVAKRLGNTKAVCRKCYIHPAILDAYMEGATIATLKPRTARPLDLTRRAPPLMRRRWSPSSSGGCAKRRSAQSCPARLKPSRYISLTRHVDIIGAMPVRVAKSVGRNVLRKEGVAKVTGAAQYIDDIPFPNLLHGRTIRSTIPSGEITDIRFNFDTAGFTIVDYRDVPRRNIVALIDDDQPCLAERTIRHVAEPILLLAHENREALLAADVQIAYRPSTPNYDPEASPTTFKTITIEKGSLDEGFAAADVIIAGEYRMGHQEQLYIEPNGVVAVPGSLGGGDAGVTVYGSMQCPYYVHRALKVLLGLPDDHVRVIQTETGGGFGGKEEYPSVIAGHAALLAMKSGRPVKVLYDRVEDMLATTKRHPAIVRHRTGVTRDGRLTAMDIDVVMDGGAYATLSAVVLSRGVIHGSGPYRCDHIRIRGRATMTNTPPNGAFRGFGAPQTQFAVEVHMDRIAGEIGLDPVRLREINALRPGDTTATGQRLGRDCSALRVLREAVTPHGLQASPPRAHHGRLARDRRRVARHWPVAVLSRIWFHRWRRGEARLEGLARAHRPRRQHSRRQHGNWSGHADHAGANRGGHARDAVRLRRRERRRYRRRAGQRSDRRVTHVHGGRAHSPAVRGRDARPSGTAHAARLPAEARSARGHQGVRASHRDDVGRQQLSG